MNTNTNTNTGTNTNMNNIITICNEHNYYDYSELSKYINIIDDTTITLSNSTNNDDFPLIAKKIFSKFDIVPIYNITNYNLLIGLFLEFGYKLENIRDLMIDINNSVFDNVDPNLLNFLMKIRLAHPDDVCYACHNITIYNDYWKKGVNELTKTIKNMYEMGIKSDNIKINFYSFNCDNMKKVDGTIYEVHSYLPPKTLIMNGYHKGNNKEYSIILP